jgi:Tetratricopeptide repeat.
MKKKLSVMGLISVMIILMSGCGKADSYYKNGKESFFGGNYEEAAQYFASAINTNPSKAEYYLGYGMALIGLSRYDEALNQFDRVIMDKKIEIVMENNKRALRGKGIAYFDMQDYEKAIEQFDQALSLGVLPDLDFDILCFKGKALVNTGNYTEAAQTYTEIIGRFGDDDLVYADRAYAFRKMGEYEKGLEDYDKAISLQANNYEYYFGKYYLLMEMNRQADAKEVLNRAEQIEVKSQADKFNLAKVHFYQGLYDQAFTELSESYANGFVEAYFYIGEIYSQKKDYSTAQYYYEKYTEEGGKPSPNIYNQIASCLIRMGEYEQAVSCLEKGISNAHNDDKKVLLKNLVIAYENLGDFESALDNLKDYLALYPADENAKNEELFLKSRMPEASSNIIINQ